MTAQELMDTALAKCAEFSVEVPATKTTAYARMTRKQEQLFARAAAINREFFGNDNVLALGAGSCDTQDLDPIPMRVHIVRIEDPGTSGWAVGQAVAIVHVDDLAAELPPRATLRDGILTGVESDLALVTSVRFYYSKRPAELLTGTDIPELPKQFHELLALDLAAWFVRKALGLADQARTEMVTILNDEMAELQVDFEQFLKDWAFTETSRFGASARQG